MLQIARKSFDVVLVERALSDKHVAVEDFQVDFILGVFPLLKLHFGNMVPERILVFCDAFCLENVIAIDFHFHKSLHLIKRFVRHKVFAFDEVEGD